MFDTRWLVVSVSVALVKIKLHKNYLCAQVQWENGFLKTPNTKIIYIVVWNLPGQLISKLEERSYADTDSVESNLS